MRSISVGFLNLVEKQVFEQRFSFPSKIVAKMCELEEGLTCACLAELVNKYNKQKDFMVRQHASSLQAREYNKIFDRKFSHNFLPDYTLKFDEMICSHFCTVV